jgi:hypothetical protein
VEIHFPPNIWRTSICHKYYCIARKGGYAL